MKKIFMLSVMSTMFLSSCVVDQKATDFNIVEKSLKSKDDSSIGDLCSGADDAENCLREPDCQILFEKNEFKACIGIPAAVELEDQEDKGSEESEGPAPASSDSGDDLPPANDQDDSNMSDDNDEQAAGEEQPSSPPPAAEEQPSSPPPAAEEQPSSPPPAAEEQPSSPPATAEEQPSSLPPIVAEELPALIPPAAEEQPSSPPATGCGEDCNASQENAEEEASEDNDELLHCGKGKDKDKGKKVIICHIPPGNPANAHSICVSKKGWENGHKDRVRKGVSDYLGACRAEDLE